MTSLPIVLKGVLHPADAREALGHGVSALIVSNHGGRQLDAAPATVDVLPDIVAAVGGAVPVLLDGGIRRGTDVLKALALGAAAVAVGRPSCGAWPSPGSRARATCSGCCARRSRRRWRCAARRPSATCDRTWCGAHGDGPGDLRGGARPAGEPAVVAARQDRGAARVGVRPRQRGRGHRRPGRHDRRRALQGRLLAPAAGGRSRGAALSDLFWYWLSPGAHVHQEHLEAGERYEEVARATRRFLAVPRAEAELTRRCAAGPGRGGPAGRRGADRPAA